MWRIKNIKFINHPVLGNLKLDFCRDGKPNDTIIIAGENGVGKTAILEALHQITSHEAMLRCSAEVLYEHDGSNVNIKYFASDGQRAAIMGNADSGKNYVVSSNEERQMMSFDGIYSRVGVSFFSRPITSVTSLELDANTAMHSDSFSDGLSTHIKQLLVDIQSLDDADVVQCVKSNPSLQCGDIDAQPRIGRFKRAFANMFHNLNYDRITNENGQKVVYFNKRGKLIPIDNLSSGEKQIVYRGCYFLENKNALNGAFVFIDEPEISLHPLWQKKILNYYKAMFTNDHGVQVSQIFVATHSPFIVHNEYRYNDKVIVLNLAGDRIIVNDKPSYYDCNTVTAVEDAFMTGFMEGGRRNIVYLEGETDELYFKKVAEVFGMTLSFDFKWIGRKDENGKDVNTGVNALNAAVSYLASHNPNSEVVCLFDFDAKKLDSDYANVHVRSLSRYESSANIRRGIENALILDNVDVSSFYRYEDKVGDYGEVNKVGKLQKKKLCDYLCSLDDDKLRPVFSNLKQEIDKIAAIFDANYEE